MRTFVRTSLRVMGTLGIFFFFGSTLTAEEPELLDRLRFGDPASGSAHALRCEAETVCETFPAPVSTSSASSSLTTPTTSPTSSPTTSPTSSPTSTPTSTPTSSPASSTALRILPPKEENWTTDGIFFTLKVDPGSVNYLTFQFCGTEKTANLLILYADGKQLGYRHLGDYDILHHGGHPAGGERPYFVTTCLPESLTRGKTELELELRMTGRIWGYGENFTQFQKVIDGPSLPIFEVWTHKKPFPELIRTENREPLAPQMEKCPIRETPGEELLEKVRERIHRELTKILQESETRPLSQQKAEFLAKGWSLEGSPVFQNEKVLPAVIAAADAYVLRQRTEEALAWSDPAQYNRDWFGTGPLAEALYRLESPELQRLLDGPLELETGEQRPRRELLAELFRTGIEWEMAHRRQFTNQSMIIDWNIQRMNRALRLAEPSCAFPETQIRRFLHESLGIEPWLGCVTETGSARPYGDGFLQITPKGLTRELGYVGNYGEVLDWGVLLYLSTCDFGENGKLLVETGDPLMRKQLAKIAKARSVFRYPAPDDEGFRAMRLETAIGWRDTSLIGPVLYGARTGKEGPAVWSPWVLNDEDSLAAYRQMIEDGQFFPQVEALLKDGSLRVSNALIDIPPLYALLKTRLENAEKENRSFKRLPMSPGGPDFVFTDEVNGVAVIRHEEEILYASLYWRARFAVNGLAKVHFMTPYFEHFATLRNKNITVPMKDGTVYRRPNWTTFGFRPDHGVHYPERFGSLHCGEELPVSEMPAFMTDFQLGRDNWYAGRSEYCELEYAGYFIAMNMSTEKTFFCEKFSVSLPPLTSCVYRNGKRLDIQK